MPKFGIVAWLFWFDLMVVGGVCGQDYPEKPIRIITSPAGGGGDFVARQIAQGISGPLGQPVTVDNRPGTGIIPAEAVAKARPDGYTVLVIGSSLWTVPLLQKTPYDPVGEFSPITLTNRSPNVLLVHPSLPTNSVKELIALAKARPGELDYASGGVGGIGHFAGELFKSMAGVNIVHIGYKGSALSVNGILGGEVHLTFGDRALAAPHIKSGRLKALAVTSADPSTLIPGLPTVAASGLPGYEAVLTHGILAPAGTRTSIINRLNQEIVRLLNAAETKERFLNAGLETIGNSPDQFAATIKSEMARLGKLIKDAGIKAE